MGTLTRDALAHAAMVTATASFWLISCSSSTPQDASPGSDAGLDSSAPLTADAATQADASADGGPADGAAPRSCAPQADPKASPTCIDDAVAAFVDGVSGSDSADGTKAHPYKTVGHALASTSYSRVFVCAGTYAEQLSITSARPVSLFGGLACASWTYDASSATTVSFAGSPPLSLLGAKSISIEDITFTGTHHPLLVRPRSVYLRAMRRRPFDGST